MINTLHDKIIDISIEKYWEISRRYSSSNNSSDLKQLCDYLYIKTDKYSVFKLGPIEVRKGRVIATIVGFLSYCLYILVTVKGKV